MIVKSITVKNSNADAIKKRLTGLDVVAGLPKGSAPYPDGIDVVQVGIDHEFGSPKARTYTSPRGNNVSVSGIPERSFMRTTYAENAGKWKKDSVAGIERSLTGESNTEQVTAQMGSIMASAIKAKIVEISTPPNSPQVVADKGSSNPLVDTGHMVQSVTYKVEKPNA